LSAPGPGQQRSVGTEQSVLDEFSDRFTKQAGICYFVRNSNEVISTVNDLIEKRAKGDSCCAPITLVQAGKIVDISSMIRSTIPFETLQKNPREVADKIDVGITKANYAIGDTGSIVDISFTDEHRLLSSLSRVHIAVLERSDLLEKLRDLAPRIRDLLSGNQAKTRPSITLIGGPSRTSDIELKSVLGVHGPHEVHVVIV
jgi:L-lactate utilization protein LutC